MVVNIIRRPERPVPIAAEHAKNSDMFQGLMAGGDRLVVRLNEYKA